MVLVQIDDLSVTNGSATLVPLQKGYCWIGTYHPKADHVLGGASI
jgi:hypothetical protein